MYTNVLILPDLSSEQDRLRGDDASQQERMSYIRSARLDILWKIYVCADKLQITQVMNDAIDAIVLYVYSDQPSLLLWTTKLLCYVWANTIDERSPLRRLIIKILTIIPHEQIFSDIQSVKNDLSQDFWMAHTAGL
jgi:hypothetical protein